MYSLLKIKDADFIFALLPSLQVNEVVSETLNLLAGGALTYFSGLGAGYAYVAGAIKVIDDKVEKYTANNKNVLEKLLAETKI